jgi:hypothetical protein
MPGTGEVRTTRRSEEKTVARKSKEAAPAAAPPAAPTVPDDTGTEAAPEPAERGMSAVDELLSNMAEAQAAEGGMSGDALADEAPDIFATQWTELDLRCRDCQIIHYVPICIFLNAEESPALVQRITKGHFNLKRCPVCRKIEYVEHPYTYYDPTRKLIVQVRPEWEWHAGGGEEWYAARLENLFDKWAEHDVRIEVVFGPQQLIDRFLQEVPAPPARR